MTEINVPQYWIPTQLGKMVRVASGVGFPKKYQGKIDGLYPVYKVGDLSAAVLNNSGLLNSAGHYVDADEAVLLKGQVFNKGTTLFAKIGEAVKLNRRAFVEKPGLADNNVMAVVPLLHESSRFVYLFMKTVDLTDISRSTTVPSIRKGDIEELNIYLPPLAEQKAIADKLDSLLAQVETTKARLDRVPDILKRFRQSVLAAAVSGRLTEEWRSCNSFDELEITHDKKLPKLDADDKYSESIESWVWIRLGFVVQLINGDRGKNYPNKSEYVEEGIPFINTGHIEVNGTLSNKKMNFITKEKYDSLGGGKVEASDLVYCLRGATMGKTALVGYNIGAIASSLVIVRPSKNILDSFAYYFLISPQAKALISLYDNGSAQPNLSAKSLASYTLQLPPLEEQTEIVRRVKEFFAFADAIEQKAQAATGRVNKLTQSILAKAFRGELTADWRAANPDLISGENSAEALLEKIRAEREALKPKKKTRAGNS